MFNGYIWSQLVTDVCMTSMALLPSCFFLWDVICTMNARRECRLVLTLTRRFQIYDLRLKQTEFKWKNTRTCSLAKGNPSRSGTPRGFRAKFFRSHVGFQGSASCCWVTGSMPCRWSLSGARMLHMGPPHGSRCRCFKQWSNQNASGRICLPYQLTGSEMCWNTSQNGHPRWPPCI